MNAHRKDTVRQRKGSAGTPKGAERTTKDTRRTMRIEIKENMVYTVNQLADILQVSTKTARAILNGGEIPARKVGQEWRVLGSMIKTYLQDFRPIRKTFRQRGARINESIS